MITQTTNLNLIPGGVLPRINVSQYDKGSRTLVFNLYNGSASFSVPVGASVTIQGTKPDHTAFQYACTYSGSTVTADLEQQMSVLAGEVTCELVITQSVDGEAVILGTCNFIINVEKSAVSDDTVISDTELPLIEQAVEAAAEAQASEEAAALSATSASDSATSASNSAISASNSADSAEDSAEDSEAYAVGTRNGVDVESTDPAYHNNAKYYAEQTAEAIENLDVADTAVAGSYVTAVSETDGLISVTREAADTTPTASSQKMVTSGGVYSSIVANTQLISDTVGWTGNNLLNCIMGTTTQNGITATRLSAESVGGIYKLSGADTGSIGTQFLLTNEDDLLAFFKKNTGKEFILSGCPAGGDANNSYFLAIYFNFDTAAINYSDTGNGIKFTVPSTVTKARIAITVRHNATFTDNTIFYPMLRRADITDPTYEPYHETVKEAIEGINSVIAPVESSATASQAYAAGEHFVRDGAFCTCISAIAQGGSFTLNTNYTAGTVASNIEDINTNLNANNAGSHNAIYRGKSLGSGVTAAQYSAISAGTFDDLYIGDYWTIDNVNYRIAAFDYYLNTGDTECTTHHVVIVPDTCLYNAKMNDTDTTDGGYVGSAMHTTNLATAKTTIESAFGTSHILSHRIYLTNAVSNGRASGGAWVYSGVDLMCEQMVYGSGIFSPVSDGSNVPANLKVEKSQLPLFAHEPSRITNRVNWALRDVITATDFAFVNYTGNAYYYPASNNLGVRPAFAIK